MSISGLDFAGPFFIKKSGEEEKDAESKSYILFLICASTHVIHLKLVPDITISALYEVQKNSYWDKIFLTISENFCYQEDLDKNSY